MLKEERVILFDGALGTMLQEAGLPPGECPELWNLKHPESVAAVHQAYVEAGAKVVETNTFGGNTIRLSSYGLEKKVESINRHGVELARQAAAGRALVAAAVGPTGRFLEPVGDLNRKKAEEAFTRQVAGLLMGEPDLIIVESMSDLEEARCALAAVRKLTELPVVVQMTFERGGRTIFGIGPEEAARVLVSEGADVVGANCSVGPQELLPVVEKMAQVVKVPVSVLPNAGLPEIRGDKTVYPVGPEAFASWVPKLVAAGARVVGGCCGTSPIYIQVMAEVIKDLSFEG